MCIREAAAANGAEIVSSSQSILSAGHEISDRKAVAGQSHEAFYLRAVAAEQHTEGQSLHQAGS